jgi:myo-inositol 2-dehydrogenase/D-chiro-inositol 1-dehydrogenase
MSEQKNEKFSRRQFVKGAAATAGILVVKPQSVFGAQANSAPAIGVIGCGGRGRFVARFFPEHTNAKIVALSDPFTDRLEQANRMFKLDKTRLFKGVNAYKELLALDLDGVVVTSPPYFHPEQATAAVAANKHVYLAKPVAVDVPGCNSILATSKEAQGKLSFLVDFQTRADPLFIEAAKRVHNGEIGELVCGQIYYQTGRLGRQDLPGMSPTQARLRNWVFDKILSGDIIVEQNIHVLDVCNWYLQAHPLKAGGTGGRKARTDIGDCWDHFIAIYWYPNDVKIAFSSSQFLEGFDDMCMRVYGTRGTVDSHYGGRVTITGRSPWEGGDTANIYADGAITNVKNFVKSIETGEYLNNAQVSVESNLTSILGRMAAYRENLVTWDGMMRANEKLETEIRL